MNVKVNGFTLIELLVVMAVIALLLTIATPRYFGGVDKSKEAVLRQNLALTRQALDNYYGDNGKYPETLEDLVSNKYLRGLPMDPIAESSTSWIIQAPEDPNKGGVFNIKSGARGNAKNGVAYSDW